MHLEEQKQECYRKKDLILGVMSYQIMCYDFETHIFFRTTYKLHRNSENWGIWKKYLI